MTFIPEMSFEKLVKGRTVLQFSPEEAPRLLLLKYAGHYLAADFLAEGYTHKIDLQQARTAMPIVQDE